MRSLLAAAVLTLASPAAARASEWFVIVSYVDHAPFEWDDDVRTRGEYLESTLSRCGFGVWWDFVGKFEGFNADGRGTVFIADAVPGLSKSQAQQVLNAVEPCAPDAYIKNGSYSGE